MCGRFTLTTNDYDAVARALGATFDESFAGQFVPRFNVAPTDPHWIACLEGENGARVLGPAQWRFESRGRLLINARSETAHERPAFSDAFRNRRCVVPADGFLEWAGPKNDRRPVWFHRPDRSILALAGLYQDELSPEGRVSRRFTILTTRPNDLVAEVHDRMPVILDPTAIARWLDTSASSSRAALEPLLSPLPDDALVAQPVSKKVGNPRNDDASCLDPPDPEPEPEPPRQGSLF